MARYDFKCESCGKVEEVVKKMTDPAPTKCPHCEGKLQQVFTANTFILNGSGWARDNYGK